MRECGEFFARVSFDVLVQTVAVRVHEMEHPVVLLRNVARTLKPRGLIGIIDYLQGEGGPGPAPEDRVAPGAIIETANAAGLKLVGQDKFLRYQYFLRFGK